MVVLVEVLLLTLHPLHTCTKDHVPRTDHQKVGFLECSACHGPYLFYDMLRQIAMARCETETMLLSDLLLTIHQCERHAQGMFHFMDFPASVVNTVLTISDT